MMDFIDECARCQHEYGLHSGGIQGPCVYHVNTDVRCDCAHFIVKTKEDCIREFWEELNAG